MTRSTLRRTTVLRLVLLTSMPVMLAACGSRNVYDQYTRTAYPNMRACQNAYRNIPDFPNACMYDSGTYWGPYFYSSGGIYTYYGYRGRKVSSYGYRYEPGRGYTSVQNLDAARALSRSGTSRGGFGTASRSSGFGG